MFLIVRRFFKVMAYLAILVGFFSHSLVATALIPGLANRRRYFVKITSKWARLICKVLDIKVTYEYADPSMRGQEGYFVACNHLSYTDLFVLVSEVRGIFVTSTEIREAPLLGYIAKRSGCVFVERRRKRLKAEGRSRELADIASICHKGHNILVFPEATSTNGDTVIPFKAGLFQAVINDSLEVLPVTINYLSVDGSKDRKSWRDNVFWYADMTFLPHLWRLFAQRRIVAKVTIGTPIKVSPGQDKEDVCKVAHQEVLSAYSRNSAPDRPLSP